MDVSTAKKMSTPKGKTAGVAQFNKITGELISVMAGVDSRTLNNDYFLYRDIEMDFENQSVEGTYDDFKIVNNDEQRQRVTEEGLDKGAQTKIGRQYALSTQINILGRAIKALADEQGTAVDELDEMLDYINEVKRANDARKQFFKESDDYDYYSRDDLAEKQARQMEGGLREAAGTAPREGGRIFK